MGTSQLTLQILLCKKIKKKIASSLDFQASSTITRLSYLYFLHFYWKSIFYRNLTNSNNFLRVLKVTRNLTPIIIHIAGSENISNSTEGFEQLVFKEKATI